MGIVLSIDGSNSISGGAVSYLINLASYGNPEKFGIDKVVLYCSPKLAKLIKAPNWLKLNVCPELNGSLVSRILWLQTAFVRLVRNSDIVYFPGANYVDVGLPCVSTSRNMIPFSKHMKLYGLSLERFRNEIRKFMQARGFRKADGVIFLSDYARREISQRVGLPSKLVAVIPHGVDRRFFCPPRRQFSIKNYSFSRPFRLLYVSLIDVYKYQWSVARAVFNLRKDGYPISVDFIGSVGFKPAFKLLIDEIHRCDPKGDFLNYVGEVPYNEIHSWYRRYDAYIFSSVCENLPFTLLEPIASGLPVACTDFELTKEIVGEDAFFFDPINVETIMEAIAKMVESPGLREEMAWRNFEKAKKYTWNKTTDRTFGFIRRVLEES